MDNTVNGEVEMENMLKPPPLETEKIVNFEPQTFSRHFYKCDVESLEADWPMVKYVLEAHNMSCSLNTIEWLVTFSTTATTNPDAIARARNLIHLLSIGVRAQRALQVLNGKECEIIETGYQIHGLSRKYGVSSKQYADRWKLFLDSLKDVSSLTGCYAFYYDYTVAAIGDSSINVKAFRIIVEHCISGRTKPADLIKNIKMTYRVVKDLEALQL